MQMISYASKSWFDRINVKITYLNRLRIMQNKAIKRLTKIYKLFNIVDIVKELEKVVEMPKAIWLVV